ncbi:MAG: hypothetical protein IJQ89_08350, partial [Bacteroidales bacterium]|nr:hypothetical protein [Bacteroidales bacterium]
MPQTHSLGGNGVCLANNNPIRGCLSIALDDDFHPARKNNPIRGCLSIALDDDFHPARKNNPIRG